jgi:hypothetical protein
MNRLNIIIIAVIASVVTHASASSSIFPIGKHKNPDIISIDTIKRGRYTLIFINKDTTFARTGNPVKQRMIDAFFDVYPREAKTFNEKAISKVVFIMDPDYAGVAETDNGQITYSPSWMLKQPTDIDVVTHELMHIVQEYGYSAGPVWLTEGIADYVRYSFGIDNAGAQWTLPPFKSVQYYDNSYRITARFLVWTERNVKPGAVKYLDAQLRAHTYTNDSWKNFTGASVDELWSRYVANPSI